MTVITANPETEVSRTITKAKLTKTSCVEVEFTQTVTFEKDGEKVEMSGECPYRGHNIAHQDLIDAFAMLHPHFAILCDLPEIKLFNDEHLVNHDLHELENDLSLISNIGVRSFTIGGSADSEGVTLSGFKKLPGGKMLNFNTAFTKYTDDNDPYSYSTEMQHVIEHICEEVELYLDGKIAPNAQPELPFGETDDETDIEE